MEIFNNKIFNPEVFGRYINRIPDLVKTELLKSGVLRNNQELANMLPAQSGGNYITLPLKGLIGGEALNYDGVVDLDTDSTKTYAQSYIVVGRMKGWSEKQFSKELTGVDFMDNVAQQVAKYKEKLDQKTILSILKGVFNMTDAEGKKFVEKHTLDITEEELNVLQPTTMNTAIQKASGDNDGTFSFAIMPSYVATNLKNLQVLEFLKYTDANGIQRELKLAQYNGISVLVDDGMPTASGYYASAQGEKGALKVVASGATAGEINLATVKAGEFYPTNVKAEDYVVAGKKYVTYVLGEGAFEYADCGAEYPYEINRDSEKNGGVNKLYMRQRKIFAPYGISFTKDSMASASPTDAELETGSNWEIVNDHDASTKSYLDDKAIPIARLISRG